MKEQKLSIDLALLLPEIDLEQDDCVQRLQKALQDHDGIQHAHIEEPIAADGLCLHYDPSLLSTKQAQKLAQQTGARIVRQYQHLAIPIEGMDCSDCALVLEHSLERMHGVLKVAVNYPDQRMNIEFDSRRLGKAAIEERIRRLGYAIPLTGLRRILSKYALLLLSLTSGIFLLLGWSAQQFFGASLTIAGGFYGLAYIFGGLPLARSVFIQITRERRFNTDQLMLAAAMGAALLGEFAEGALLLFLFGLGHALEHHALDRARNAILGLRDLAPKTAIIRTPAGDNIIPVEKIQINDIVRVLPNARISVDGRVKAGSSAVDQSAITGEFMPRDITVGDLVFAGSVNGDGSLEISATRLAKDSTLAKVAQLVQEAQTQKSPSEQFSDSIIRYFVPGVVLTAIFMILIPPLLGAAFKDSFLLAMTLLIAASPCALALGTPSAVLTSLARAARSGVLVKAGAHLETLGAVNVIAFDKTGTLTIGKPAVDSILPLSNREADGVLALAASVEAHSGHPIAHAIVEAAKNKALRIPEALDMRSIIGFGVEATIAGRHVSVGKLNRDDRVHVRPALLSQIEKVESSGKSLVAVKEDSQLIGLIGIRDQLRDNAPKMIRTLKKLDVDEMVMLTGDNSLAAQRIARQLELDDVRAGLLPEEKLEVIAQILASEKLVAMVGDGVNDAPALAAASVGIAMGGAKTQVALETADIVLMSDDLSQLPFAVGLGRMLRRVIRQNFMISLTVIAGLLALTLMNLAGITLAILLHEGSTLIVILNSLRLLAYNKARST